jgi:hypothetical protein
MGKPRKAESQVGNLTRDVTPMVRSSSHACRANIAKVVMTWLYTPPARHAPSSGAAFQIFQRRIWRRTCRCPTIGTRATGPTRSPQCDLQCAWGALSVPQGMGTPRYRLNPSAKTELTASTAHYRKAGARDAMCATRPKPAESRARFGGSV